VDEGQWQWPLIDELYTKTNHVNHSYENEYLFMFYEIPGEFTSEY
jgi:hypothetical protein